MGSVDPRWFVGAAAALLLWLAIRAVVGQLNPQLDPGEVESLYGEYVWGRLHPARLAALEVQRLVPGVTVSLGLANKLVCVEVASGRYAEALTWRTHCPESRVADERELLLRINEAEALANLGRVEESLAWLDRDGEHPVTRAGIAAHRAWCLTSLGRLPEARAALSQSAPEDLWEEYRSEWFFSLAVVATAERAWPEAEAAPRSAEALARRASSFRNVLFLKGLLRVAQGRLEDAVTEFELGARHVYTGQGGVALLAWGDALEMLGRTAGAREAWRLCCERDPQSPAASAAAQRVARTA